MRDAKIEHCRDDSSELALEPFRLDDLARIIDATMNYLTIYCI